MVGYRIILVMKYQPSKLALSPTRGVMAAYENTVFIYLPVKGRSKSVIDIGSPWFRFES